MKTTHARNRKSAGTEAKLGPSCDSVLSTRPTLRHGVCSFHRYRWKELLPMLLPARTLMRVMVFPAVGAAALVGACSPLPASPPSATALPSLPTTPAPAAATPTLPVANVAFDEQFIDMMVPHHQAAVEMARIAQTRAQRPEIQGMAADILRSHSAEIDSMHNWRQAWFGSSQTPPMERMRWTPSQV